MFAKKDLLLLFNLLKIFKIGRINKIIYNLNVSSTTKTVILLLILNIFLDIKIDIHDFFVEYICAFFGLFDLLYYEIK